MMIDAGRIDYALVVDGEGAREIHENTLERLERPDATREDVLSQFATLTLGSGAAAMVLGRADEHPEGHRLVGGVLRAATEHHELCVGDLDGMTHRHQGPARRRAWRSRRPCGPTRRPSSTGRTWTATSPTRSRRCSRRRCAGRCGSTPTGCRGRSRPRGNMGPASIPFTLATQVDSLQTGDRVLLMGVGSGPQRLLHRAGLVTPRRPRAARPPARAARARPGLVAAGHRRPRAHAGTCSTHGHARATGHAGVRPRQPDVVVPVAAVRRGRAAGLAGRGRRPARDGVLAAAAGAAHAGAAGRDLDAVLDALDVDRSGGGRPGTTGAGRSSLGWAVRAPRPAPRRSCWPTPRCTSRRVAGARADPAGRARRRCGTRCARRRRRSCGRRRRCPGPRCRAAVRDAFAAPYGSAERRRAVEEFVADIPLEPGHPSAATLDGIAEEVRKLDDVPVLLLWGPRDPVFSDRYLRDLRARLPHADVQRYERASHLVLEDAPEAAARRVGVDHRARSRTPRPGFRRAAQSSDRLGRRCRSSRRPATRDPALWAALEAPRRRPLPRRRRARRPHDLLGPARPPRPRARGRARRPRRRARRPRRAARPARRRPHRRRARLLAGRGVGRRRRPRARRGRARPGPARRAPRARRRRPARARAGGRARRPGQPDRGRTGAAGAAPRARVAGRAGRARPPRPGAARRAAPRSRPRPGRTTRPPCCSPPGATGPAKGVVYRHRPGRARSSRRCAAAYGITARRPARRRLPAVRPLRAGARDRLGRPGRARSRARSPPPRWPTRSPPSDATMVFASPAALRNVVAHRATLTAAQRDALAGVRRVVSAGAPVPASLLHALRDVLPHAARAHAVRDDRGPARHRRRPRRDRRRRARERGVRRAAAARRRRRGDARSTPTAPRRAAHPRARRHRRDQRRGAARQGPLRPALGGPAGERPRRRGGTAPATSGTSTPTAGCGWRAGWST